LLIIDSSARQDAIERITDLELDLMYLPRGNILQYRSLD
jgi:hypothetical protein